MTVHFKRVFKKGGSLKFGVSRHVFKDSIITENYRSEGGKSIHFVRSSLDWLFKNTKIVTTGAAGKILKRPKSKIYRNACAFA